MFLPSTYFAITSVRNGCDGTRRHCRGSQAPGRWTRAGQRLLCFFHDNKWCGLTQGHSGFARSSSPAECAAAFLEGGQLSTCWCWCAWTRGRCSVFLLQEPAPEHVPLFTPQVLGLLVWSLIAATTYHLHAAYGWVMFVSLFFWILTLLFFVIYLLQLHQKYYMIPWPLVVRS